MQLLVTIGLLAATVCAVHVPGIGLKLDKKALANLNQLLTPIIMSRYSNKRYPDIDIHCFGPEYDLRLFSLDNLILDPLSTTMETLFHKSAFKVHLKDFQGYATFSSEIAIKGRKYTGAGRLIFDQTTVDFFAEFIQRGAKDYIDLRVFDIFVDKTHVDVIYYDQKLNQTLNAYKDVLKEAYSAATKEFIRYLVTKLNAGVMHNLVLGYTSDCGFNVTMVDLPHYDKDNNEWIFFLDGAVVDMHTMKPITTEYPSKFPLDSIKTTHKNRVLISDKTLEGLLVYHKPASIRYSGRNSTITTTTERIPEIFTKYSKSDTFYADLALAAPFKLHISEKEAFASESAILYNFTVQKEGQRKIVFTCKVTMEYRIKWELKKHIVSFAISKVDVKGVDVIFSDIELKTDKLKKDFEHIMEAFKSELKEQPLLMNYRADGLPVYYSYYFNVKEMNELDEFLEIKFEAPSD